MGFYCLEKLHLTYVGFFYFILLSLINFFSVLIHLLIKMSINRISGLILHPHLDLFTFKNMFYLLEYNKDSTES